MFWKIMLYIYFASIVIYWFGLLFLRAQTKFYKSKHHVKVEPKMSKSSGWASMIFISFLPIINLYVGLFSFFCYEKVIENTEWMDE